MTATNGPEGLDLGALALLLIGAAALTVARGLAPLIALIWALLPQRPTSRPKPTTAPDPPQHPAAALPPVRTDLQALNVAQLRRLARSAGLRALARSGRRVDLLQALAHLTDTAVPLQPLTPGSGPCAAAPGGPGRGNQRQPRRTGPQSHCP